MSNSNSAIVDDLIWAREMLRIFAKMEKALRRDLGSRGIEKIVIKSPINILLFSLSILIGLFGIYFYVTEKDILYFGALLAPIGAIFYIFSNIRDEKNKNIFRFVANLSDPKENLITIIEEHVFKNKEQIEEIIAWKINQLDTTEVTKELEKFAQMFNVKVWQNIDQAQEQCNVLAILMVTLQRFLHKNRSIYEEQVKKLPLMNPGYNYKPTKKKLAPLVAEDIQTFGGGFTTEDLFTGNGK
jgi:hypothetical protein